MSTPFAIGAVTAVLKHLLDNGLTAYKVSDVVGGNLTISALPPDRISLTNAEDPNQLNLFLYQITYNQGWRNVGLPSRDDRGERISNPPLPLNLHYLLTAYGAKDFYAEIILGHAMQLLHDTAVLTRDSIRRALAPPVPPPNFPAALTTSQLADQVEQLKITPEVMNTEEISRLWSALQAHYRPTAAYQVTVVLLESSHPARTSLPVLGRNGYVVPFQQPVIEKIVASTGENAPILPTSTILIQGQSLRADTTQVCIGGIDLSPTEVRDTQITVAFPAPLPTGMRAGVQTVQVVHPIAMGTPPQPHRGVESNIEAFVLRPIITPSVDSASNDGNVNGSPAKKGEIKVQFNPKVGKTQRVVLLLNEFNPPANRQARAYSFKAPPGNGIADPATETDSIKIAYKKVIAGDYLVRVQVNGAESLLQVDGTGKYATPKVTI